MGNRSDEMLSIGLLEIAVLCWPVTLGLLAISGLGLGLGHLLSRAEARGRARALAAALLAALPRPTLRALDDELHRRLGLVRRHRGPRRRSA